VAYREWVEYASMDNRSQLSNVVVWFKVFTCEVLEWYDTIVVLERNRSD